MGAQASHGASQPSSLNPIAELHFCRPKAFYTLPSGSRLAYDEYGTSSGRPLIYFHDGGSSRLECAFFHASARQLGFRLIAVDRPGIGCSDYYSAPTPSQFCNDVMLLTNQLGITDFGVMSLGAGGIYALSLARNYPDRVSFNLCLAGLPGNVFNEASGPSYAASCWNEFTPPLIKMLVRIKQRFFPDDPEQSIERLQQYLSFTDRKTLFNPRVLEILALDHREALRLGNRGVAQDLAVCFRKLEFSLMDVKIPTMIWQGCADRLSRRSDCEFMAARMPNANLYRVPNRGHFFFVHSMDEVFRRLRSLKFQESAIAA